ncbi:MAG: dihydropteroate synthase [Anaerolineaceae bacterium]|nr:dihydropteroate synthase [Anaerolineaceae bacterium]
MKKLTFGTRTYVMGIINFTPDSFSGDGLLKHSDPMQAAIEQAHKFVAEGADILDIGGESTRPGSQVVTIGEELERVLPLIKALAAEKLDCLISVDTSKAVVAERALLAGADWVNDVWGLRADPSLAGVVAAAEVPVVLMHNRSKPNDVKLNYRLGGSYVGSNYKNLLKEVIEELKESIDIAHSDGVKDENIVLDPGIGFGKSVEHNLELINRLDEIKALGYPVLLGSSRKSFIGYTLDVPPDQRLEGTAATVSVGILRGADIIRVHDVEAMVRVARMTDAILGRKVFAAQSD